MPASPSRDLRLARLPLLLAYLLVLLGTPVGEAGFRWMHLTTAHSTPAKPGAEPVSLQAAAFEAPASAPEHEPDTPPAHEHNHAAPHEHESDPAAAHSHADADPPEHIERIAGAEIEPVARSAAPDEPHEHGGRVHTHQQHPVPDAELLIDALSKFYLAPSTTPATSPSADPRDPSKILPAPHQAAARIDTPPPRLPG